MTVYQLGCLDVFKPLPREGLCARLESDAYQNQETPTTSNIANNGAKSMLRTLGKAKYSGAISSFLAFFVQSRH